MRPWVHSQHTEAPRECVGSIPLAGEEEGESFVSHFFAAHTRTVSILSLHQRGQQVVGHVSTVPAIPDQGFDAGSTLHYRPAHAYAAWQRQGQR